MRKLNEFIAKSHVVLVGTKNLDEEITDRCGLLIHRLVKFSKCGAEVVTIVNTQNHEDVEAEL